MVNEFHKLELLCVPPQLIPPYGNLANQGCALPGAVPGSTTVDGEAYLHAQLNYSYSHLWRNVGVIVAFWAFFVLMTLSGLEMTLKARKGGGTVNVYKKGPEGKPSDEEAQHEGFVHLEHKEHSHTGIPQFAERGGLLSWNNVGYAINVNGQKKVLLTDISGYVKPGRMTALMGGITPNYFVNCRIWGWQDYFVELSCAEICRRRYRTNFDRRTALAEIVSTVHGVCRAI